MSILNYTTKIPVEKTAMEISMILAAAGAQAVHIEYVNRVPSALSFVILVNGQPVSFRLPSRWDGVYKLLREDSKVTRAFKTEDQARRVSWRIIKDWVEAQMAIIQAGAAELAEVFLPYAVRPQTGQTLFEEFKGGLMLGPGEVVEGEIREG
jgi:hypothetical protein